MKIDKSPLTGQDMKMIPPKKCSEFALSIGVIFLAIFQIICYIGITYQAQKLEPIMTTVTTLLHGKDTCALSFYMGPK